MFKTYLHVKLAVSVFIAFAGALLFIGVILLISEIV